MMTDSASSSSSSSFGNTNGWTYDVFLSFRGADTRLGFTGNLYDALCVKGIHTFIDDEKLQRGNQITPTLVNAIQHSKIAVVVLSKNYASSSFCLDELVNILDCSNNKGSFVLPIFYGVDPSDLRHLSGSYGEALAKHEERFKNNMDNPSERLGEWKMALQRVANLAGWYFKHGYGEELAKNEENFKFKDNMERLEKWKMALQQVANLSGWHFKPGDGYEYKFIGSIVEVVSNKINRPPLHVAHHPVGLEFRVLRVKSLLYSGSDDGVRMVGIYGIGGIGKTTLARAVYNLIAHQFEGLCFLEDVRRNSMKYGLVHLQETLLSEIVGEKDTKLASVSQGIPIIKHRLQLKKVLLVLDDVDELEQLKATIGGPDWFGSGSRVIITTRDKHLLTSNGVERTYEVEELNEKEALELLSWNAFKTDNVDPSYLDILSRAVTYACGLPLAMEVIGSNLFGKTTEEWESALDQYERIPDKRIHNILKISYDSLMEHQQKIFLDIACFFKGCDLAYVKERLFAHHGVRPEYSIGMLVEKSLIKIHGNGSLTLHDLIEDMGKEIVRQESPEEPSKRSRLWFHEDIIQALEGNKGTSRIQIIILDFLNGEVDWDGKAFKKMENLKTLVIRKVCFSKGPKHLPNSLRVLEWPEYPSTSLPSDFYPKKLVILNLPQSCLMSLDLSMSKKKFVNLIVLTFNRCQYITETPDVFGAPNLEKLSFNGCENLIKIHESVGFLDKLRILDATSCNKLRNFPPIKLASLEKLELSDCSRLESFPEILGKMEAITELDLFRTGIKELPFSIQYLTQLRILKVRRCGMSYLPSSIVTLPELEEFKWVDEGLQSSKEDNGEEKVSSIYSSNLECLGLAGCLISDEFLRKGLTWFANVKYLDLSGNNFTIVPACIKECHFLKTLKLNYCKLLRNIKGIPPNLETFTAVGCTSLNDLDLTVLPACTEECHLLRVLILDYCENLKEITGLPSNIEILSAINCKSLTDLCRNMLLNQEFHERVGFNLILPGARIPEWFEHRSSGPSISFWFRNDFPTVTLCIISAKYHLKLNNHYMFEFGNEEFMGWWGLADHIYIFDILQTYHVCETLSESDEDEVLLENDKDKVHLANEWNHVEVSISSDNDDSLLIGLHVVKQECCMDDIRFTNPYKGGELNNGLITSE